MLGQGCPDGSLRSAFTPVPFRGLSFEEGKAAEANRVLAFRATQCAENCCYRLTGPLPVICGEWIVRCRTSGKNWRGSSSYDLKH